MLNIQVNLFIYQFLSFYIEDVFVFKILLFVVGKAKIGKNY